MKAKLVRSDKDKLGYLHFTDEGFSCKLVPAMGGSIQELIINDSAVIWGCEPSAAGMKIYKQYCNGGWLFPFPNRIENGKYEFNGESFLLELNDLKFQHAIHGVVCNKTFKFLDFNDQSAEMEFQFDGTSGFPFPFRFSVLYEFGQNEIQITVSVENTGKSTLPMGIGWHPYFNFEDPRDCNLKIDITNRFEQSDRMIPLEAKPYSNDDFPADVGKLDDLFEIGDSAIVFRTSEYNCTIDSDFGNYVQLYAPPGQNTIAIEPMSCPGNAFNSGLGLQTLSPGDTKHWTVQLNFH